MMKRTAVLILLFNLLLTSQNARGQELGLDTHQQTSNSEFFHASELNSAEPISLEVAEAIAQAHEGHEQPIPANSMPHSKMSPENKHLMEMPKEETGTSHEMQHMPQSSIPKTPEELMFLNMQRSGSGTSWQPLDNPMLMKMKMSGPWLTMLHWSAFLDYDNQGGRRGNDEIISQNWLMASTARPIGERGLIQFRGMMSAEPFTVGKEGYPLLFQTGETFNNQPLIDRQHPHDLFMELSTQYWHQVQPETCLTLYLAPVGEPALGPVAFPHRYSAFVNPESPLGHHEQDSTHIAFGVLTAGIIHKNWQVEGSVFNGKEPDENRYNFDFQPFMTSFSGRISYLPNPNWALQVSHGFLNDPEAFEPGNINRTTASTQYTKTWDDGWLASTLSFGHNFETGPDDNSALLESTWNFKNKNYLFGRVENVQKSGLLRESLGSSFNITAFSLGYAREVLKVLGIPLQIGAMVSVYAKPGGLDAAYGDFPVSFHVFLHTNPSRSHRLAMGH